MGGRRRHFPPSPVRESATISCSLMGTAGRTAPAPLHRGRRAGGHECGGVQRRHPRG